VTSLQLFCREGLQHQEHSRLKVLLQLLLVLLSSCSSAQATGSCLPQFKPLMIQELLVITLSPVASPGAGIP
jgi:hypothetical protein